MARSKGEGSIVRRRDGRWQASLQVDCRRRAVCGPTRAECVAKLDALKRQATQSGALPDPGRRTLSDLLAAWLETKAPNVRPRTLADYRSICARYIAPSLGRLRLTRATPDRIERPYAHWQTQGKDRTALKIHQVLAQALDAAVRWGWLPSNPTERLPTPRHKLQRRKPWTPRQLRRFLDGTRDHWLHPLWTLLACSGARLGETLALVWDDVDLAGGTIAVTKSAQRIDGQWVVTEPKSRAGVRVVALPGEAVEALRRQAEWRLGRGGGPLVFAAFGGGPLSASTVQSAMQRECLRLGLPPMTPHGLRHLHASLLLAEGLPVPEVSRRLGHAHTGVTAQVYSHAVRDDTAAVAAIERALERQ